MTGIAAIFWFSLFIILYAYLGYPAVLWLISLFLERNAMPDTKPSARQPSVSLIVSAYNEEQVIGSKIANSLSLDYPRELLEIVIISDGSTDRTVSIALAFGHQGIVVRHYEGRIGKTACLNQALPLAQGGIIVFTDANSIYEKGALKALLHPFQDCTVGFVTGWTRYGSSEGVAADSLGLYSRLELITKELESRLGSCIGADGAIFAIRKELYLPLKDYDINDFVIPLSINQQGYRGVLQREAICFERDAGSSKGEFKRQVRITSRTIRAIVNYRRLLNPFRFGLVSIELFSHKVCKFLVPLCMVALLISSLILRERGGLYLMTLIAQAIFYVAAAAAWFLPKGSSLYRIVEAARTFVILNAAIACAWVNYVQGKTYTTWSPTKR
jgi:cellulose synthase/poly-beta-1,6-N-acetylglucosamine synthase-like glycosyltransferase